MHESSLPSRRSIAALLCALWVGWAPAALAQTSEGQEPPSAEAAAEAVETPAPEAEQPVAQPEGDAVATEPGASAARDAEAAREREVESLARELRGMRTELTAMFDQLDVAQGEERRLLWERILRRGPDFGRALDAALALIETFSSPRREELTSRLADYLDWATELLQNQLEETQRALKARRLERPALAADELLIFEQELSRTVAAVDELLRALVRGAQRKQALGVDPRSDLAYLDRKLGERAEELTGRLLLASNQRAELGDQGEGATADEQRGVRARQRAVSERLRSLASGLSTTIELMDGRELDTARYKQQLIRATGDLTTDVLDTRVALGLFGTWWEGVRTWARAESPRLLLAIAVFLLTLLVFRLLASVARRVATRALGVTSARVPILLRNTAASLVSNTVMLIGLLVALSQMGIEVGPMLASLGIAGFIIGFALQDSLSNFAAGAMILLYHPFDVGDVVEAGSVKGTVRDLSLVSTTILTFDNQRMIVPNRKIWGDVIRNVTAEETRRVDIEIAISYREDLEKAWRLLHEIAASHEKVLEDPSPLIRVNGLSQGRVDLIVRPWARTSDYWSVFWDLNRAIKERFDAEGLALAVPERQVALQERDAAERGPE